MKKKRLDDILLEQAKVTDAQIKIALKHQKIYGGRFGSLLMHHGFINEEGLVNALATQFECEGVILSSLNIPAEVLNLIPAELAVSRLVVPFDYDEKSNTVHIACEEPLNESIEQELKFVLEGKNVKLYVAAEIALMNILNTHYKPQLDITGIGRNPYSYTSKISTGLISDDFSSVESEFIESHSALLVTDEDSYSPLIRMLLQEDNYEVTVVDSARDAIDLIKNKNYKIVFIKDTVSGDYLDLIDRLRKKSPSTIVRYFESASQLLFNENIYKSENSLLEKNLEIFTSLLAIKEKEMNNHSGRVGDYVRRLCHILNLPPKERMIITSAAYIHDLAKFYYPVLKDENYRKVIEQTVKLLQSLNYDPVVVEMLKSMYIDLKQKYTKRLPIEVLGGNILTICDLYCDNFSSSRQMTIDKYETLKTKFNNMVGHLFLQEIVDGFISLIQKEMLNSRTANKFSQILIYSNQLESMLPIETRMKNDNFRTICINNLDSFLKLYIRSKPDMIILHLAANNDDIKDTLQILKEAKIDFYLLPTILLVTEKQTEELQHLYKEGIEDIIDYQTNHDFIIMKVKKIRDRAEKRAARQEAVTKGQSMTKGNLTDLNLIDLIQALGPSRRTVRINVVSSVSDDDQLIIYMHNGHMIYAKLNQLTGPESVYEALKWQKGIWSVEQVAESKLPEPNNELSNESILMEGCRLIDESAQSQKIKVH